MSEDKSETPNLSRRDALKIGAVVGGVALLGREAKTFQEQKIETDTGVFYPLYEYHDRGIKAEDIPNDLDGFFREYARNYYYDDPPVEVLYATIKIAASQIGKGATIHPVEFPILKKLAQNGTKVIFGDTKPSSDMQEYRARTNEATKKRLSVAATINATGFAYITYKAITDKLQHIKPDKDELTRRKFIAKSAVGAGLILGAPITRFILQLAEVSTQQAFDQKDAALRVIQRLETLVGTLVPEDHLTFFRSIVMVDKILTVAENIQRETGRKPKIAFHVGAGHSIMEDILLAGHDFSRFLLSLYPEDFLREVEEVNGGLENFCSARVFTLNQNVTQEDVDNRNNNQVVISEERIVDQPLLNTLKAKLVT